jgi:hypothetical protein
MSWPSSFGVAVLTAIVGLFATGFLASLTASWYRVPNLDLQSTAYVASLAIFGMIGGFIIGVIASRVVAGGADPGFFKALSISQGVLLGLLVTIGGVARLLADIPPTIDGEQLMLAVELRWPASHTESPAARPGEPTLTLGSLTRMSHTQRATSTGPLWASDAHLVDGRWVAPGAVDIFTTRGRLSLTAMLDSTDNHGFILPLSGAPRKKDMQWTEWYPHAPPGAPPLPDGFQYRYRVQKRSEPVRTESVGPFDVQTIAWYFFNESMEMGKTVLATNGRFTIRYRGQPVVVDAKQAESKADTDTVEKADGVVVIGGTTPALLVHFVDSSSQGPCYLLADDDGHLRTTYVPDCTTADGSILTTDTTVFRNGTRKVPRGRLNRIALETPGLYSVGGSVLDTRRLAVYTYKYPESFSIFPGTPPLGISPDERSFVRIGSDYNNGESHPSLAVADFVGNRSYLVPIDQTRMRYANADALDPAWLSHHFTWQTGGDGVDSLVERKGFVPIAYHTRYVGVSGYWLEPAREPLRDAIIELLITEFKGERVPVESYAYEHPVKIGAQIIQVAYNDTGDYVSISVPTGVTDTTLLDAIAKRVDAVLATGKYDSMFGK